MTALNSKHFIWGSFAAASTALPSFRGADAVDGSTFKVYKGKKNELAMDEKGLPRGDAGPHRENFLAAVRSRNYQHLHTQVQIGVTSANLCHLANISYRLKQILAFDPATEIFQ